MLHKHLSVSLNKHCISFFRNKHISQLRKNDHHGKLYKINLTHHCTRLQKVNETESTLINSIVKYTARIRAYYNLIVGNLIKYKL